VQGLKKLDTVVKAESELSRGLICRGKAVWG